MSPIQVREGVRALVTAYINDDTIANPIAADLAADPTDAYNAIHELASLLDAVLGMVVDHAKRGTVADLWQHLVLVDMEKDL